MAGDLSSLLRFGTVVELDLASARCRVAYGDPDSDDVAETDWIAWTAPRAGDTRIWCPPSIGEQVLLLCPDGQLSAAVAVPGLWRDIYPAPASGAETMIAWPDGARVIYDAEASEMQLALPAGGTVQITAGGGVTIEAEEIVLRGDVTIDGDVSVSGRIEAQGDVVGDGVSLATHRHGEVQVGVALSSPPVP